MQEMLDAINPAALHYQDWIAVGMALKHEGYSPADWDLWSTRDPARYRAGECMRKWNSFQEDTANPVTGGTLYDLASKHGWKPEKGHALGWDDTITFDGQDPAIDPGWVEVADIEEPADNWDPINEITVYLNCVFSAVDYIGLAVRSVVTENKDGKSKYVPEGKGVYARTAGDILNALNGSKKKGDKAVRDAIGDYDPAGGVWIRFNPLDGKGIKNANVTEFRYALVECDDIDIGKQYALIKELELPVVTLVHSGGKSLHAVVRIDAGTNQEEYRKRVDYLYKVCEKNGLKVDTQNKNPSRLSRLPGVMRNGHKQFLVATNIGKRSWDEWKEWIEEINDNLPGIVNLADIWGNMKPLADPLIDGVLRKGHKMLLVGPSKAGKSFLQIELCIAIAEGRKWLEWQCTKGKVIYVNLELDAASCHHRFRDVYESLKIPPDNLENIDIWDLRGRSLPMTQLAPKLIRRAQKKNVSAVIIDPIYKVITGDENSAAQMAEFCNQFDKVCTELGCAVVYCHHHSKGMQGQKKSMDRASGSGVFARDPDALLDMIQLETTDALMQQEGNKAECEACLKYLENRTFEYFDWEDELDQDTRLNARQLLSICENRMEDWDYKRMIAEYVAPARRRAMEKTAWRIEGTLREFVPFQPVNVWFDYPVHRLDDVGSLKDIEPEMEAKPYKKRKQKLVKAAEEKKAHTRDTFSIAFETLLEEGSDMVPMQELAEQAGIASRTIGGWLGSGKKADMELQKYYEKVMPEKGGIVYVRRKEKEEDIDD